MSFQIPTATHCGRQWGCPSSTILHFSLLQKERFTKPRVWFYQAIALKGSPSTTVPSLPHTEGLQLLNAYKQAVLSHPHSKALGILSHSTSEWPRSANRQAKPGRLPAPSLHCTRQQTCQSPNATQVSQYIKLVITAFCCLLPPRVFFKVVFFFPC